MWSVVANGCHPDRETWAALEAAGFAGLRYDRFRIDTPPADGIPLPGHRRGRHGLDGPRRRAAEAPPAGTVQRPGWASPLPLGVRPRGSRVALCQRRWPGVRSAARPARNQTRRPAGPTPGSTARRRVCHRSVTGAADEAIARTAQEGAHHFARLAFAYQRETPLGEVWQADDPGFDSPDFLFGASGTGHFFLRKWRLDEVTRPLL